MNDASKSLSLSLKVWIANVSDFVFQKFKNNHRTFDYLQIEPYIYKESKEHLCSQ